jgi:hypothetical protein
MGVSDVIGAAPWSDHDPYTDEALLDPWPGYRQLRDAGPAVWLPMYEMFAPHPVRLGAAGKTGLGVLPVSQRRDDERSDEPGAARQHTVQRRS